MLRRLAAFVAASALAAGTLLASPAHAGVQAGDAPGPPRQASLPPAGSLLVATFPSGTARVTSDGRVVLAIAPDRDVVGWFSNRPQRTAGHLEAASLPRLWPRLGFTADPPEAALVLGAGAAARTSIVELRDPRWVGGRLTFTARVVTGSRPAGSFGAGSLFIDGTSTCLTLAQPQQEAQTIIEAFDALTGALVVDSATALGSLFPQLPVYAQVQTLSTQASSLQGLSNSLIAQLAAQDSPAGIAGVMGSMVSPLGSTQATMNAILASGSGALAPYFPGISGQISQLLQQASAFIAQYSGCAAPEPELPRP